MLPFGKGGQSALQRFVSVRSEPCLLLVFPLGRESWGILPPMWLSAAFLSRNLLMCQETKKAGVFWSHFMKNLDNLIFISIHFYRLGNQNSEKLKYILRPQKTWKQSHFGPSVSKAFISPTKGLHQPWAACIFWTVHISLNSRTVCPRESVYSPLYGLISLLEVYSPPQLMTPNQYLSNFMTFGVIKILGSLDSTTW